LRSTHRSNEYSGVNHVHPLPQVVWLLYEDPTAAFEGLGFKDLSQHEYQLPTQQPRSELVSVVVSLVLVLVGWGWDQEPLPC